MGVFLQLYHIPHGCHFLHIYSISQEGAEQKCHFHFSHLYLGRDCISQIRGNMHLIRKGRSSGATSCRAWATTALGGKWMGLLLSSKSFTRESSSQPLREILTLPIEEQGDRDGDGESLWFTLCSSVVTEGKRHFSLSLPYSCSLLYFNIF